MSPSFNPNTYTLQRALKTILPYPITSHHPLPHAPDGKEGISSQSDTPAASPDPWEYARLVSLGIPKKVAKVQAGYSANTPPGQIDRTVACRLATMSIEEQRTRIASIPGFRLIDCLNVAKITRDKRNQAGDVVIRANEQIMNKLNYNPPIKQEITDTRTITMAVSILHSIAKSGQRIACQELDNTQDDGV